MSDSTRNQCAFGGRAPRARRPAVALAALLAVALGVPASAAGELREMRGGNLQAAGISDQDVIVILWASWSPRCRDIVERVNGLNAKWSSKARVVAMSFNEDRADVEAFLAGKEARVAVVLDQGGEFAKGNGITSLPGVVLVRGGKVVHAGKMPDDIDSLLGSHFR